MLPEDKKGTVALQTFGRWNPAKLQELSFEADKIELTPGLNYGRIVSVLPSNISGIPVQIIEINIPFEEFSIDDNLLPLDSLRNFPVIYINLKSSASWQQEQSKPVYGKEENINGNTNLILREDDSFFVKQTTSPNWQTVTTNQTGSIIDVTGGNPDIEKGRQWLHYKALGSL